MIMQIMKDNCKFFFKYPVEQMNASIFFFLLYSVITMLIIYSLAFFCENWIDFFRINSIYLLGLNMSGVFLSIMENKKTIFFLNSFWEIVSCFHDSFRSIENTIELSEKTCFSNSRLT